MKLLCVCVGIIGILGILNIAPAKASPQQTFEKLVKESEKLIAETRSLREAEEENKASIQDTATMGSPPSQ